MLNYKFKREFNATRYLTEARFKQITFNGIFMGHFVTSLCMMKDAVVRNVLSILQ